MELNLQKQTVSINETIYDGVVEQPLECDVLLPDYCPDIQKILRCEVVPSLLLTAVNGDKLSVDGMAMAHLYYLDENGCIRHAEYKIPTPAWWSCGAPPRTPRCASPRASTISTAARSAPAGSICAARSR